MLLQVCAHAHDLITQYLVYVHDLLIWSCHIACSNWTWMMHAHVQYCLTDIL